MGNVLRGMNNNLNNYNIPCGCAMCGIAERFRANRLHVSMNILD